jgi:hypothetical protein
MSIKNILVGATFLVAAVSAFADGTASTSGRTKSAGASNMTTIGMVEAPSPSLIYFSDASYPVQPQVKSNVSRAEVKAEMTDRNSK